MTLVVDKSLVSSVMTDWMLRLIQTRIYSSSGRGHHLFTLLVQKHVFHLILLVPDALLDYLAQSAEVEALESVQVNTILGICVMTKETWYLGEFLGCGMIKRSFMRH
jgi:hypothetical protein